MAFKFRIPHKFAEPKLIAAELTHIIEDNTKLLAELSPFPRLEKECFYSLKLFGPDQFKQITDLSSKEIKSIHEDLWKFYQKLLTWIAVAKFLQIEISNPQEVQKFLDDTWHLLNNNPYTRIPYDYSGQLPRELTPEELSKYQQVLISHSNKKL